MLTINPSSHRSHAMGDGPATVAPGSLAANPNHDPAGFASLLRQTRMAPPPAPTPLPQVASPAPAPASASTSSSAHADKPADGTESPDSPSADAAERTDAHAENDPTARVRAQPKGKFQHATDNDLPNERPARSTAKRSDVAPPVAGDTAGKTAATGTTTKPTGSASDASVMQWLAGLQHPATAVADKADPTAAGTPAETTTLTSTDARAALAADRAADAKVEAALQGRAHLGAVADPTGNGDFGGILVETRQAAGTAADTGVGAVDNGRDVAAANAAAAQAPGPTTDIAAPAAVTVAAPVTAPDFAQELGMHLSVLAKDGVQQAELHLNPADMGPVSVQITMDGTQAHVAFGADMAATRHAIESGLPELASALRDAGYTLAGGGVSQHAGGRSGGHGGGQHAADDSGRRGRSVGADSVGRVATAARRIVRQGGVDLFA